LVLQKRRPLLAVDVRRRMRRMELARPTTVVVVERDIMGSITRSAFWRAAGESGLGRGLGFVRSGQPEMGAGAVGDPRYMPGASVVRGARPEPWLRIGDW
jgi:hypothetical protein